MAMLYLLAFSTIIFVIWFVGCVEAFLRLQRKKLRCFEEMLESQKETNEILRFIASTKREDE